MSDAGHVYAVFFTNGLVKFGGSTQVISRVKNHARAAKSVGINCGAIFIAFQVDDWKNAEDSLMSMAIRDLGDPTNGKEYFRASIAQVDNIMWEFGSAHKVWVNKMKAVTKSIEGLGFVCSVAPYDEQYQVMVEQFNENPKLEVEKCPEVKKQPKDKTKRAGDPRDRILDCLSKGPKTIGAISRCVRSFSRGQLETAADELLEEGQVLKRHHYHSKNNTLVETFFIPENDARINP